MDRKLYKTPFEANKSPDWLCPNCLKGLLRVKAGTFHYEELSKSREARDCEAWDPDWIDYTYSCLLQCSNDNCKEIVANTGKGIVDIDIVTDEYGYPEQVYQDYFNPLFFYPHLKLIPIPDKTPLGVSDSLDESFKLFFNSPSAASNHVRAAIEALLTDLKVKRYEISRGKRRIINLHRRIGLLPKKFDGLKDLFYAVKWLGNAGSHAGEKLNADDVMDAYEIMEYILKEVYVNKAVKLKKIAKKVNKAKGPKK